MAAPISRRRFLAGLGLLALGALPACRRAQEEAVALEDAPEWLRAADRAVFATSMPWATGALPLLGVCHGGLPTLLEPHPQAARPGLPAFAQASILDLYSPSRAASPAFNGRPFPWRGLAGAFRAWAGALAEGRSFGFLFPAGWSAVRQAQAEELKRFGGARCYAWDPAGDARPALPDFPELARQQQAAFGEPAAWDAGMGTLEELTRDLPRLDFLFIFTPADPAAHDAAFADALRRASAETVRFHLRGDATSALCAYAVPQTHFLEEWGAEADAGGNLCLRQPLTLPLRPALAEAEALHALLHGGELPPSAAEDWSPAAAPTAATSPVRAWLERLVPDLDAALRRGMVPGAAPAPRAPEPLPEREGAAPRRYLHPIWVDGRFSHNAWLRETFDALGGAAGRPAVFLPGEPASGSAVLGGLALPACRIPGLRRPLLPLLPGLPADAEPQWRDEAVAPMQAAKPAPPLRYGEPAVTAAAARRPQWGMVIDLAACIGCQACVVACRAENNVPIVGEEEQRRGRDLQWLRVTRYLDAAGRTAFFLPAACRQCEDAPCEAVCPVNATVHTSEGLNAMVYPRCWGTRYCAAACPYQARRFNFHDYAERASRETSLPPNPQVTVRSRGVMEKCTYCAQRLEAARADAAVAGTEPAPPAPACAAACPAGAIRLVDFARTPPPSRALASFDAPGTRPRTLYTLERG